MLVDTDVLIWHLRGYPQATRRLDALGSLTLSAVSYLEVLQGIRNKNELVAVKKMLERRAARVLPVTEGITQRATELMELLTLSHGLQMGDALIAATAIEHRLPVLTANVKHFGAVNGLEVEAFTP
ncbi:MAG TPA: type II toxin-antitoxin system VapC family toxin [Ramlibacter sp.]|nr:type II toxin-antitoxin system VapC family toxin [Ramlibacter sp.]